MDEDKVDVAEGRSRFHVEVQLLLKVATVRDAVQETVHQVGRLAHLIRDTEGAGRERVIRGNCSPGGLSGREGVIRENCSPGGLSGTPHPPH